MGWNQEFRNRPTHTRKIDFQQNAKGIQEKGYSFLSNWHRITGYPYAKKNLFLASYARTNLNGL